MSPDDGQARDLRGAPARTRAEAPGRPGRGKRLLAIAWKVLALVALVLAMRELFVFVDDAVRALHPESGKGIALIGALLVVYALLLAIPFVPGLEMGVTLLLAVGPGLAPFIYLATLCGLMLAFFTGRVLRYPWLVRVFRKLRLRKTAEMIERMAPRPPKERLQMLQGQLPRRLGPLAGRGRYLMLALLLCVPGNSVIGGGGGIMLIAGLSRVFRPGLALLTAVLALLPFLLLVWGFGPKILHAF